jgi:hypothetical protein
MVQKRHIHKLPAKPGGRTQFELRIRTRSSSRSGDLEPSLDIIRTSFVEAIAYQRHNAGFAKSRGRAEINVSGLEDPEKT